MSRGWLSGSCRGLGVSVLAMACAGAAWGQAPAGESPAGTGPQTGSAAGATAGSPAAFPTTGAGLEAAETAMAGQSYVVPSGTKVLLAMKSAVNTKTAKPGDGVYLVSTFPVIVGTHVLLPVGMYVQGVVDRVDRPGRIKGRAKLLMHFTTMILPNGQVVSIPGVVNTLPGSDGPSVKDEGTIEQAGNKGHDAGEVAKAAGTGTLGGVIGGAVAGSPGAGAAYGGLAGAGAGMLYTLFTRGNEITIPEGTSVEMVLQRPVALAASQLAGINDVNGNPQYMPVSGAQRPLPKPGHMLCPPGSLGCR